MNDLTSSTCHSLMSISKSLAGMVAGRLIDREVFDPDAEVAAYIPELKHTAYGDATAQQVWDMAASQMASSTKERFRLVWCRACL